MSKVELPDIRGHSQVELPNIRAHSNKTVNKAQLNKKKKTDDKSEAESEKKRKMASMRSVDKLLLSKNNSYNNDYYPKQLEDQKKVDEAGEVHANLTALKKSCDAQRMRALNKEVEIERMRKEHDSIFLQVEQYRDEQKRVEERTIALVEQNEEQARLLTDSLYMRKVYEHMLQRMKKDQLVYQLRANEDERFLNQAKYQCSSETYKYQQINELHQKIKQVLRDTKDWNIQQNKKREKNLYRFKEELKNRLSVEQKREERIKRQQEIAEVAANDIKDSSLKKWRKLLLVHKFLNSFLKNKMQRGIAQYSNLEQAFQQIKAQTGINDPNQIVKKFLEREQTYSQLLIQISEYDKKIKAFETENGELLDQFQRLEQEFSDMDKEMPESHKQNEELSNQIKLVQEMDEKVRLAGLLDNKLQSWIKRNLKKLGQDETKGFETIVNTVKEKLSNLSQQEQYDLLNQSIKHTDEEIRSLEFQKRNVRVKPLQKKKEVLNTSSQHESMSRDEGDIFEEQPQNKEEEYNEEEEEKYLEQLRLEVKQKLQKK